MLEARKENEGRLCLEIRSIVDGARVNLDGLAVKVAAFEGKITDQKTFAD